MIPITIEGKQYVSNVCEPENGCNGCAAHRVDALCGQLPYCHGVIFKEYVAPAKVASEETHAAVDAVIGTSREFDRGYAAGCDAGLAQKQAEWDRWMADRITVRVPALSRATDPATSLKAARDMSRKAGRIIDLILVELTNSPMTGKQLAANTGVALNSITPRFAGLSRRGLIHATAGAGRETVWALGNGVA